LTSSCDCAGSCYVASGLFVKDVEQVGRCLSMPMRFGGRV
jgi:hypothetical protein